MNIKQIDWNAYHKYLDKLADKINLVQKVTNKYKYIAGVDPDDMIAAVHLSHSLNLPLVTDVNLLSLLVNFSDNSETVLVVSNVVETGNSFQEIMNATKSTFDTAVLFVDKNSKYTPSFYVEIPEERIYFPWQKCGI